MPDEESELSDDELLARLIQRGVNEDEARRMVRHRDDDVD